MSETYHRANFYNETAFRICRTALEAGKKECRDQPVTETARTPAKT